MQFEELLKYDNFDSSFLFCVIRESPAIYRGTRHKLVVLAAM